MKSKLIQTVALFAFVTSFSAFADTKPPERQVDELPIGTIILLKAPILIPAQSSGPNLGRSEGGSCDLVTTEISNQDRIIAGPIKITAAKTDYINHTQAIVYELSSKDDKKIEALIECDQSSDAHFTLNLWVQSSPYVGGFKFPPPTQM